MRSAILLALALCTVGVGCAKPPLKTAVQGRTHGTYTGPDEVTVDLVRPSEGGPRIYVQARLPDGELGLFMIDTGADVSVLSEETALRLGLEPEDTGRELAGLAGTSPLRRAVLPELLLGDASVANVEFAVGVPGVPTTAGWMPQDGILGNNVWSRFLVEIDYPADTLVLHRPGTQKMPRRWMPMFYDGFVNTPIEVVTDADPPHHSQVIIKIDTGASGLILSGTNGAAVFDNDYSEGVEPIYGIGGSDDLPASQFLRTTRRVPVSSVMLGGVDVDGLDIQARWINFEGVRFGPQNLQGLAGHDLMADHVAWFDYQGSAFALTNSKRKPRLIDGHVLMLEQDIDKYGADDKERLVMRAKLHIGLEDYDTAIAMLSEHLQNHADDHETRVLLTHLYRSRGDLDNAWTTIEPIEPGALVDEREIVAAVNGLLLENRPEDARTLAEQALSVRPDEGLAHVALADVLLAEGHSAQANGELLIAAQLVQNPDGFLDRRARTAMASDDRYGAMAHLRKMLQIYPFRGPFMWFYALMLEDTDKATFQTDMEHAMERLHPFQRPLDFQVASHHVLGNQELALEMMQHGIDRDCADVEDEPLKNNCIAWYSALAGHDSEESLRLVESALEAKGDRSDFLDTKAVVHLTRGEFEEAHRAAVAAARLSPDDVYMLWQAERIGQMAAARSEVGKNDEAAPR